MSSPNCWKPNESATPAPLGAPVNRAAVERSYVYNSPGHPTTLRTVPGRFPAQKGTPRLTSCQPAVNVTRFLFSEGYETSLEGRVRPAALQPSTGAKPSWLCLGRSCPGCASAARLVKLERNGPVAGDHFRARAGGRLRTAGPSTSWPVASICRFGLLLLPPEQFARGFGSDSPFRPASAEPLALISRPAHSGGFVRSSGRPAAQRDRWQPPSHHRHISRSR